MASARSASLYGSGADPLVKGKDPPPEAESFLFIFIQKGQKIKS